MLKRVWIVGLLLAGLSGVIIAQDDTPAALVFQQGNESGLIFTESANSVDDTQAKLEAATEEAGLTLMTVIDHAANAANNGLELRPTRLAIFGNPNVGTPLMQAAQSVAIDLPQKMLIWEAEDGKVYIGFNDPAYLAARHGLEGQDERLSNITTALTGLMNAAAAP